MEWSGHRLDNFPNYGASGHCDSFAARRKRMANEQRSWNPSKDPCTSGAMELGGFVTMSATDTLGECEALPRFDESSPGVSSFSFENQLPF
ncbi:hypothetical protein K0M31_000379 [Melipona bicolor]|uniref:Uncharacterized protein n=1 Tax=Melipona bicolor TaxID=60889 RepID=A0AA40GER0_9HYME|nr:hypothetical protein K0M31_000379 [Melipona bicolor]